MSGHRYGPYTWRVHVELGRETETDGYTVWKLWVPGVRHLYARVVHFDVPCCTLFAPPGNDGRVRHFIEATGVAEVHPDGVIRLIAG